MSNNDQGQIVYDPFRWQIYEHCAQDWLRLDWGADIQALSAPGRRPKRNRCCLNCWTGRTSWQSVKNKNNSMQSGRGSHLGKSCRAEKRPNVKARGSLGSKAETYQILSTSEDVGGRSALWQLLDAGGRTLKRHPETPKLALSKEAFTR